MAEKLNNFEKFERKKNKISAQFSTKILTDDWPDALDSLTIGLVPSKCTKIGKTSENLILSRGLSYTKIPLWYLMHGVISFFLLQCNANRSFCPYKAHIRMKRTLGLLRNRNVFLARCSTTSNEAVVWDARVDGEKRRSMQLV